MLKFVGVEVLRPGGAGYDTARIPQIPRYANIKPAAIARCANAKDVAEALALRDENGLAIRSGGHCFAGRSSTTGLLIDVSATNEIAIGDGTVTVGAGAKLGAIYDALEPHNR